MPRRRRSSPHRRKQSELVGMIDPEEKREVTRAQDAKDS